MSGANEKTPWKDGYWAGAGAEDLEKGNVWIVKGSLIEHFDEGIITTGKWMFGKFGKATKEMKKFMYWHFPIDCEYNLKMVFENFIRVGEVHIIYGILQPDGKKCYFHNSVGSKEIYELGWKAEDEVKQKFKTKPKVVDNQSALPMRQTRQLRLPKIHQKYQPSLVGVRAISGRIIGAEVSYTV